MDNIFDNFKRLGSNYIYPLEDKGCPLQDEYIMVVIIIYLLAIRDSHPSVDKYKSLIYFPEFKLIM